MRLRRCWVILLGTAGLSVVSAGPTLAQVRDFSAQGKFDPVGTASVAGTIVTADAEPRPVRRVVVTITEATRIIQARVVTSDESGRFRFTGLPAGRYSVSASREPYLTGVYGAKRVAGPGSVQAGTVIVVASGQRIAGLTVKLMRSSVITGTVLDADGQPARGVAVNALFYQRSPTTGEQLLVNAGSAYADDRGAYRIYGLKPGAYLVAANVNTRASDAMVPRRRQTGAYVPVYFPGTTDWDRAASVPVDVAEERGGVDFQLQFVSTSRIEGVVTGPDGPMKQSIQVRAIGATPTLQAPGAQEFRPIGTDEQGRFTVEGLAPDTYTLEAETRMTTPAGPIWLWGRTEVRVFGDDRSVTLQLQPTHPLAGRVVFDATTLKPPDMTKVRVSVTTAAGPANSIGATPSASGDFTIASLKPGRYRLDASLAVPSIESGWYVKSGTVNDQDFLDPLLQVRPGEPTAPVVLTMTDRPTELSGTMTDASNSPAPEYFIIAFSAHSGYWTPGSRRIMQARPSTDGSFTFKNLPAGDYLLAAVTDVQQDEWYDPLFLAQLVDSSIKVTIGEHTKVRQDIRLR